jgi:hypothetical protein
MKEFFHVQAWNKATALQLGGVDSLLKISLRQFRLASPRTASLSPGCRRCAYTRQPPNELPAQRVQLALFHLSQPSLQQHAQVVSRDYHVMQRLHGRLMPNC